MEFFYIDLSVWLMSLKSHHVRDFKHFQFFRHSNAVLMRNGPGIYRLGKITKKHGKTLSVLGSSKREHLERKALSGFSPAMLVDC